MEKHLSPVQIEALALGEFRVGEVSTDTIKKLYRQRLITRTARNGSNKLQPGTYRISALGERALKTGSIRS